MKTDHLGVVLPPGLKLKPVRIKVTFRDYREHRKILFENRIQAYEWSEVFNATDTDVATNLLNQSVKNLMDECFPKKTVQVSARDPPWITPLVKYLMKKRSKAISSKVHELSARISTIIGENRKNWGKLDKIGSQHWWRKVDNLSQRKQNLSLILDKEILIGLNQYFDLCFDDQYLEPTFMDINESVLAPPMLDEPEVMAALSRIKITAAGPDGIPFWV